MPVARRCILSKFYIKPQLQSALFLFIRVVSYRNSTSNHNRRSPMLPLLLVVSYRNSTSNHNSSIGRKKFPFVVSYRNSTSNHNKMSNVKLPTLLYLIEILHQTTTSSHTCLISLSCILSKFYIKPQLNQASKARSEVVSYRNSTSNHNAG